MADETLILVCSQCGQKNRVPRHRLAEGPACGHCGAALPPPEQDGHPVTVTDDTFQQEVLEAAEPVLLDCWAPWCAPCRMLAPILEQVAQDFTGRVKVAKLNVDENPRVSAQLGISGIPALFVFRNGQIVDRFVGAWPKQAIENRLAAHL